MTPTMDSIRIRQIDAEQLPLTDLQRALLKSRVKILNEDDVREYQVHMLAQTVARAERALLGTLALTVVVGLTVGSTLVWPIQSGWRLIVNAVIICACLLAIGRLIKRIPGQGTGAIKWRRYNVGLCGRFTHVDSLFAAAGTDTVTWVPRQARRICRSIGATGVEAAFYVEQLDADPFLLVRKGEETYYLFAWDEQGFTPRSL